MSGKAVLKFEGSNWSNQPLTEDYLKLVIGSPMFTPQRLNSQALQQNEEENEHDDNFIEDDNNDAANDDNYFIVEVANHDHVYWLSVHVIMILYIWSWYCCSY